MVRRRPFGAVSNQDAFCVQRHGWFLHQKDIDIVPAQGRDDVNGNNVVPAKAGTHTPCRLLWETLFDDFRATTNACGYGSLRSQGRRAFSLFDSTAQPSLRANGSRECAPDDRLREAIHGAA
jgi:hypothetical protein